MFYSSVTLSPQEKIYFAAIFVVAKTLKFVGKFFFSAKDKSLHVFGISVIAKSLIVI
jgi:hypothetical protein